MYRNPLPFIILELFKSKLENSNIYIVPNYNESYMKKPYIFKKEQMLYIKTARQRIAQVFFRYPEKEFSLSDLAKEAKVKKSNIGAILTEMQGIGFIEIAKLSAIWRIKANVQNPHYLKNKIVHNLAFVYHLGIVEFLNDYFKHPKAIVLFGSFRKGDDISASDIDLAVESEEAKGYQVIGLRELSDLEKRIGRKVQIHLFNRKNIDSNLFNNIANGIVLSGFLEVNP